MFLNKKICMILACSFAIVMASPGHERRLGGQQQLSGEGIKNAEQNLQNSLDKLAAGDGPYYKISKVISGTKQLVQGTLTRLNVDLIDENADVKNCNVAIWAQIWLKEDGIEITFDCPGEEKVVKKHAV